MKSEFLLTKSVVATGGARLGGQMQLDTVGKCFIMLFFSWLTGVGQSHLEASQSVESARGMLMNH